MTTEGDLYTGSRRVERSDIDDALSTLENEAGVPVVMGEGLRWCKSVLYVISGEIEPAWARQVAGNKRTLRETLSNDIELAARVEKLRAREEEVARELYALHERTRALAHEAESAEGSKEPTQQIEELRERWLGWIVSCRALSKEIQTWFVEATYRDIGAGD